MPELPPGRAVCPRAILFSLQSKRRVSPPQRMPKIAVPRDERRTLIQAALRDQRASQARLMPSPESLGA